MSGSTIGGGLGAAIGYYFGGSSGAKWGFVIGSIVGGYIDPAKSNTPGLGDVRDQTADIGVPIPFGYGVFACRGNVIWRTKPVPHKSSQGGKGGGSKSQTSSYTRSYAIGICKGEADLYIVKKNGKIVYDTRTDAVLTSLGYTDDLISKTRAISSKWMSNKVFYRGTMTQMPDPTQEAYEGVGNVSPNRGLAKLVAIDDDVTDSQGAVPQYEFVMAASGATTTVTTPGVGAWANTTHLYDLGVYDCAFDNDGNAMIATHAGLAEYRAAGKEWRDFGTPEGVAPYDSVCYYPKNKRWYFTNTSGSGASANGISTCPQKPGSFTHVYYFDQSHYSGRVRTVGESVVYLGWVSTGPYPPISPYANFSVKTDPNNDMIWVDFYVPSAGTRIMSMIDTIGGAIIALLDDGTVWSGGFSNSWGQIADLGAVPGTEIHRDGVQNLYVCCGNDLHRSTNHGLTWTIINNYVHACPVWAFGSLYTSSYGHVYRSLDYGVTFSSDWDVPGAGAGQPGAIWSDGASAVIQFHAQTGCVLETGGIGDKFSALPDSNGYFTTKTGLVFPAYTPSVTVTTMEILPVDLADVVLDISTKTGVSPARIDVSDLVGIDVLGFVVATEGGADSFLAPLMAAYMFDKCESDGKLHFIRRGRDNSFAIGQSDLLASDTSPLKTTRVQEAELLKKLTVAFIDPALTYTRNTQSWRRRGETVLANGESIVEVAVTASTAQGATIAKRHGAVAWSETDRFQLATGIGFSSITPGDTGTVEAKDGHMIRVRVEKREDQDGRIDFEMIRDRKVSYELVAIAGTSGNTGSDPSVKNEGLSGPTVFMAMNLPQLRDADTNYGMYLACAGILEGFVGCIVQYSLDDGATWKTGPTVTAICTMGYLAIACGASGEPANVTTYGKGAIYTVSDAQITNRENAFAIVGADDVAEIVQVKTSTPATTNNFDLTNITRGEMGTAASAHAVDARFTSLDQVVFMPLDSSLDGKTIKFRPVSIGTDPELNAIYSVVFHCGTRVLHGGVVT